MVSRLVLGCDSLGHAVVQALAEADGRLRVLDDDAGRVDALRDESIPADLADTADPAAIRGRDPVDVAFVAEPDPERSLAVVSAAREAYPATTVVTAIGADATAAQRAALRERSDRTVDPGGALLDWLATRTADGALGRRRGLAAAFRSITGSLAVVTHDNPDPDAIGSAVALARIAERCGVPAEICYYGEISHQENRAMVNLLSLSLTRLAPGEVPDHDAVALVDHARPGVNDGLPPDAPVRIVVDHHPIAGEAPPDAFVDRRVGVGATSTLLAEYVECFDVDPAGPIATGLIYGIRVDTDEFRREVSPADFEAVATLLPHADADVLDRIESPSATAETFDTIARAVRARERRGTALVSVVGGVGDRDALAQAADRLLALAGVTVTVVAGHQEGTIYVSGRARGADVQLGQTFRTAFGELGSAGGHDDMAGAQLPLGIFDAVDVAGSDALDELVRTVVTERFFAALAGEPLAEPSAAVASESSAAPAIDPADRGGAGAGDVTGPDDLDDPEDVAGAEDLDGAGDADVEE